MPNVPCLATWLLFCLYCAFSATHPVVKRTWRGCAVRCPSPVVPLCRLEALRWVTFLLQRSQDQVLGQLNAILPALLDALSAPAEPVVAASLTVLAAIAACPQQFK